MICDSKRVAYVRIPAEDIFYSLCRGEQGIHNGRVQTVFLKVFCSDCDKYFIIPSNTRRLIERVINVEVGLECKFVFG